MDDQAQPVIPGPPYVNPTAALAGGHPTVDQDIPVCAILILIYLIGAITNMTIFQLNRRRRHKFYLSWALFGFCMCRITTFVLRLVLATRQTNVRLAIAAGVFTNAGVLVIYIILLLLSLRVFRATHPQLGWNRHLSRACKAAYALVALALILVIAFTILTFYTLDPDKRKAALWIQRTAILYLLLFNLAYLSLFLLTIMLPPSRDRENFGKYGSMRSKLNILGPACLFTVTIAGFRMGTSWSALPLAADPPWWDSKPAFYLITFGFEIVVLYLLTITRFDQRFWIPNGSSKPGDYSATHLDDSIAMKT